MVLALWAASVLAAAWAACLARRRCRRSLVCGRLESGGGGPFVLGVGVGGVATSGDIFRGGGAAAVVNYRWWWRVWSVGAAVAEVAAVVVARDGGSVVACQDRERGRKIGGTRFAPSP